MTHSCAASLHLSFSLSVGLYLSLTCISIYTNTQVCHVKYAYMTCISINTNTYRKPFAPTSQSEVEVEVNEAHNRPVMFRNFMSYLHTHTHTHTRTRTHAQTYSLTHTHRYCWRTWCRTPPLRLRAPWLLPTVLSLYISLHCIVSVHITVVTRHSCV